ncbi:hypothetical protein AB6A40_009618 [Gnathostoma spinigerum]|uniref:Uncharacterized protein n=1 Tax=Gnathostoma spinigerum TaxID=75299 RepID=A0ABD6EZW4_9BILA
MGSQTDSSIIGTKTFREVGTDPDPELSSSLPLNKATTSVATETSPNLGSVKCEAEAAKPNEISGNATRMQLTSTLSNSEEQSISELFQVITRKTDKNDCSANDDRLKDNGGSEKKAGIKKNDLMEVKRLGDPRTTNSLAETDALLQMTNPKASSRSSNVSSCSVPTSLLPCIPDQFTHVSTAAASPVFSDISDDAPTLEKEVSDKGDERVGSERMRSTNSSSLSTLGALRPHQKERTDQCISMVSDKVDGSTASSDNLADPSALLCPSAASSLTTTANNPSEPVASVSSETTGTPSEVNKRASEVSSKPVPVINNPLSSYAGVTGPSAMSPFIGIDPTFGLRAASGGIPVSLTGMSAAAAMMYSPQLMMSYGSPSAVPSASVPQAATLPANTISKHKIHDLKASCSPSISSSRESSQGVPKSSMLTSPVGRPQSSGSSGGLLNGSLGSANLSNSHKHGSSQLNPGSANSRSSSTATSLSSMQPTTSTTSSISGGAQAMNIMQQQQQVFC